MSIAAPSPGIAVRDRTMRLPQWLQMIPIPRRHWTPRYIRDRVQLAVHQHANPLDPWLTRAMVGFLAGYLRPTDTVVEFGSGRSTAWFARRVSRVVSTEHHPGWHAEVLSRLARSGLTNVDAFCPGEHTDADGYLAPVQRALRGPVHMVLVDGQHRDACACWALQAVLPGGVIVVDNVNWFIPRADTRRWPPGSLRPGVAPATALWARFAEVTAGWRRFWTTDGITDTAAFFRPADVAEVVVRSGLAPAARSHGVA